MNVCSEQKKALEMDCLQSMGTFSEIGFLNGFLILTLHFNRSQEYPLPQRLYPYTNHFIDSSMCFVVCFESERERKSVYIHI